MLKSIHRLASGFLSILLTLSLVLTPLSSVRAQVDDTEAPVLIHRQIDAGVAGELQTFLARVSDDFGVSEVILHYRQSDSGEYQTLNMRPLVDSIGEYMIAIETSVSAYAGLQYYIEAFDMSGNQTNRGFSYAPIILPLTAPAAPTTNTTPGPIVEAPKPVPAPQTGGFEVSPTAILIGVGALLALGAIAGGSSGGDPPATTPDPGPATVTLTVISDLPTAN